MDDLGDRLAMKVGQDKLAMTGCGKLRSISAKAALWLSALGLWGVLLSGVAATAAPTDGSLPPAAADAAAVQIAQQASAAVPTAPAPVPQAQSTPGLFPTQPPPAVRPGFIYAFGRWWDTARGKLDDLRKQSNGAAQATQDALKHAAQATKNAATVIARLPASPFIEINERCAIAPNGAPDCRTAAANACRSKGFSGGHPVDVQSSENCPPAVWMSGREPAAGQCPEETVVLLAACD